MEYTNLTERHHAFIAASFYKHLAEEYAEHGKDIFIFATRTYGEERGRRMAERALRDGKKLDFHSYKAYSEWAPTMEMMEEGSANRSENLEYSPDYMYKVTVCPWAIQFAAMDLKECGSVYCRYIDKAIVRGFNPDLRFEVPCNLNDRDHCIQIMKDADFDKDSIPSGNPINQESFAYHCAHIYFTFSRITVITLKEKGHDIIDKVKEDYISEYGRDSFAAILSYSTTDFSHARDRITE